MLLRDNLRWAPSSEREEQDGPGHMGLGVLFSVAGKRGTPLFSTGWPQANCLRQSVFCLSLSLVVQDRQGRLLLLFLRRNSISTISLAYRRNSFASGQGGHYLGNMFDIYRQCYSLTPPISRLAHYNCSTVAALPLIAYSYRTCLSVSNCSCTTGKLAVAPTLVPARTASVSA